MAATRRDKAHGHANVDMMSPGPEPSAPATDAAAQSSGLASARRLAALVATQAPLEPPPRRRFR